MKASDQSSLEQIKRNLVLFILGLVLSGLTAFPIESQLRLAHLTIDYFKWDNFVSQWVEQVYIGVKETNARFPFISYGTDWLAFAHLVIGIAFIGPVKDPVRNIWVIEFGIISCMAVFPLALIAGAVREIPFFWRLIDCSFGLFGGLFLWRIRKMVKELEGELANANRKELRV
jgi:hypothetical protein